MLRGLARGVRLGATGGTLALRRRCGTAVAASAATLAYAGSLAALCDSVGATPADAEPPQYVNKFDDPEANARALAQWRARIQTAREQFARDDHDGAEATLRLAIKDAEHFGASSGPFATSMLNLAQLYRRRGKLDEAAPLLLRAFHVLESTAGPNNRVTLLALIDLALTLSERGEAAAAKERYDDALARLDQAMVNQVYGDAPSALRDVRANCLLHAAQTEQQLGSHARAEELLRESLALVEQRWGATSPRLVAPCTELARLLLARERRDEARAMFERAARVAAHPVQQAKLAELLKSV